MLQKDKSKTKATTTQSVGGGIKMAVKDTISYNPNGIIKSTEQLLLEYLPELENIIIDTYNQDDITKIRNFMLVKKWIR